jgi:hypothetical protein
MASETWVLVTRNDEWRPVYPQGMRVACHSTLVDCVYDLIGRYGDLAVESHREASRRLLGYARGEQWSELVREINEWVDPDEWSIYCEGRGYVDSWAEETEVSR